MKLSTTIINQIGEKVTTISELGGIGEGFAIPADMFKSPSDRTKIAFKSGGNGFYYAERFKKIMFDGGEGYIQAVKGIFPMIEKGSLAH